MSIELLEIHSEYLLSSFGQPSVTGLSRLLTGDLAITKKYRAGDGAGICHIKLRQKPYTGENELVCRHFDPTENPPSRNQPAQLPVSCQGRLLPANHALLFIYTASRVECLAIQPS
jgi:hypothetical protein